MEFINDKKYKLTALKRVGRTESLIPEGAVLEDTWENLEKRMSKAFINGCEIEEYEDEYGKFKVYAGYGSHVSDIKLEMLE